MHFTAAFCRQHPQRAPENYQIGVRHSMPAKLCSKNFLAVLLGALVRAIFHLSNVYFHNFFVAAAVVLMLQLQTTEFITTSWLLFCFFFL